VSLCIDGPASEYAHRGVRPRRRRGHVDFGLQRVRACHSDLLGEDLDVPVRIRNLPDSTLRARRLAQLRLVALGSRNYLQQRGRPRHPRELEQHTCIVRTVDGRDEPWSFLSRSERQSFQVRGRFRSNDTPAIREAALPVYAVFPPTRTRPAKVRRFVDLLAARLKQSSL
jgi:DNA-binding transcriptional LysR family regulator